MCQAAKCAACGKTTWDGCGQHVQRVMSQVPEAEQCTCRGPAVAHQPAAATNWSTRLRSVFGRS